MSTSGSQIRWGELSEREKKEMVRVRNARTAKSARQRRQAEEDRIGHLYKENESRMDLLEDTVDQLTKRAEKEPRRKRKEGSNESNKKSSSALRGMDSSALSRGATFHISAGSNPSKPPKDSVFRVPKDNLSRRKSFHKSSQDPGRPDWFGDAF